MFKSIIIPAVALTVPVLASASCMKFDRSMHVGDTGEDIKNLQIVLNSNRATQVSESGDGSPGEEIIYFGRATRSAVIRFQNLYRSEILGPSAIASGNVGVKTRKKLAQLSCGITQVSPAQGVDTINDTTPLSPATSIFADVTPYHSTKKPEAVKTPSVTMATSSTSGSVNKHIEQLVPSFTAKEQALPVTTTGSQFQVIGNHIFLFGGWNDDETSSSIYSASTYDPYTWTPSGRLPGTLHYSQSQVIGDYIYLFGGIYNKMPSGVILRAPVSNPTSWVDTGATLPGTLYYSKSQVIGDYVYLFGGLDKGGDSKIIWRAPTIDPTNWTSVGTLPGTLIASQFQILGDYIYSFGGNYNIGHSDVILRAPTSDPTKWTKVGVLPGTLANSQSQVIGNYIYLFGGAYNGQRTSTIWRASTSDPLTWTVVGALPAHLTQSQLKVIGDYVYLFGGEYYNSNSAVVIRALIQ